MNSEDMERVLHLKIGIISDTHDNLEAIDNSVEIFNTKKVGLVVHAGDIISPFAAARFQTLKAPMKVAFGNNDGERTGLLKRFRKFGAEIGDFGDFHVEGKRFAVYHGTIEGVLESLIESGKYDVVVSGHSHETVFKTVGKTLFINPGEACGYLGGKKNLCILNLNSMKPESIDF